MRVLLLRHGEAGKPNKERWPDDRARPLTDDGVKKLTKTAKGLARTHIPSRVFASPSVRTYDTARVMQEHAGWPAPEKTKLLKDGGSPQKVIDMLNALHERNDDPHFTAALVGHEPQLSALGSFMLTGNPLNSGTSLKKGGATMIEYHPQPGKSVQKWMAPGKLIAKASKLKHFSEDGTEFLGDRAMAKIVGRE
jgi:phosphohistidine phosphatase SixA